MDSDEDDAYLSESGEAQMLLKKRGPQSQPAAGGQRQPKKKKKTRSTQAFRDSVKAEHGVDLEDVPNLKNNKAKRNSCRCKSCGSVKENKAVYWKGHRTKCEGAKRISEKRQLRLYTGAGGEQHRQKLVDTYMLAYFAYKERLPFTMPSRLQRVLPYLHCVDKTRAEALPLSDDTITRYGERIAGHITSAAKKQFNDTFA